jgi:hypothetical protein
MGENTGNEIYEIDYEAYPLPGVGKFVTKPQKITAPAPDEPRERFREMRAIASKHHFAYNFSIAFKKPFEQWLHQDHAALFYEQAMLMKDFTDDYPVIAPFSQYYPHYQMMGYEQLRTYFTWRTEVRQGCVRNTSLSYAFLYIYELLVNIGVTDPREGLDKLLAFGKTFKPHHDIIGKYMLRWLKDYHIYYQLPWSFNEFVAKNNLASYYPEMAEDEDSFELFCKISKYDIRKSAFFTEERATLIRACFSFLLASLRQAFADKGLSFDEAIFQPAKASAWLPFKNALFYPWLKQPDRRVVISANEIYTCRQNQWTYSATLADEQGRQLLGYIMKRMDADLRKAVNYKYKLSASGNAVSHSDANKWRTLGLSLDGLIQGAVGEFYRETTKTVVTVDPQVLSVIRREALVTQEKLTVPEDNGQVGATGQKQASQAAPAGAAQAGQLPPTAPPAPASPAPAPPAPAPPALASPAPAPPAPASLAPAPPALASPAPAPPAPAPPAPASPAPAPPAPAPPAPAPTASAPPASAPPAPADAPWRSFKSALTAAESQALALISQGGADIKALASLHGLMPEVLIDGLNGKAMDHLGDSLMDEDFVLYEEYKEQVKEWIG